MNGVQVKKVAKYMLLPGIVPRAKKLFASGFGTIAFLIASIFNIVRLLPAGHPYIHPGNIGRFGIRHVMAEAANNLVLSRRNIDQIIIFILILSGLIIMLLQLALAVYGYVFRPALAASMFVTQKPTYDIAYILLDEVFGIPNMFNSCIATMQPCSQYGTRNMNFPWGFHDALHSMFSFYSLGLLFIGLLIFLYFVFVIIVETAATGHPFGQRFQNVWVPIRIVIAFGLLVPISNGLNTAQYVVLYAAKYGSSFATNTWLEYNNIVSTGTSGQTVFPAGKNRNPIGEQESLLAKPVTPSTAPFVQAVSLIHACAYGYWKTNPQAATQGGPGNTNTSPPPPAGYDIQPYLVKNSIPGAGNTPNFRPYAGTNYASALQFYDYADIVIVFGRQKLNDPKYSKYPGNVMPLCGNLRVPINYLKNRGQGQQVGGPDQVQQFWYDLIGKLWRDQQFAQMAHFFVETHMDKKPDLECQGGALYNSLYNKPAAKNTSNNSNCEFEKLPAANRQKFVTDYNAEFDNIVRIAWDAYRNQGRDIAITQAILDRGWAGAGIWYNIIADINGGFVSAVMNMPLPSSYPMLMEQVLAEKQKGDAEVGSGHAYDTQTGDAKIQTSDAGDNQEAYAIAKMLGEFINWWNVDSADQAKSDTTPIGNFILDVLNLLFSAKGLMEIREYNAEVHPLAQLSAIGKSLVDSAIIYVTVGVITAAGGGLLETLQFQPVGALLSLASDMAIALSFIGLTAGFVLYYVLPFLPFLYFFFAVTTWIKTIFEAMVGAPLWALAHLRLDGEGLPGEAASTGYFLIFDISLRPVLSVIALVGAMLILTAQVRALNMIWDLVIDNLTGYTGPTGSAQQRAGTTRGVIDGFFFTILYTIVMYMLATASFKLIDSIPDNILRFMGGGVQTFSDINPDATEGLTRYASIGGITFVPQMTQSAAAAARGLGGGLGSMIKGGGGGPQGGAPG